MSNILQAYLRAWIA